MARSVIKYKTQGFSELSKALDALIEPKFRSQALRIAGRKSMTPLLVALKSAAPISKYPTKLPTGARPGLLRDSLTMRVSAPVQPKIGKRGSVTKASRHELSVAIYTGREADSFAIISEYGRKPTTVTRYSAFGRPVLGFEQTLPKIEPKPWMRTTFDAMKAGVLDDFKRELGKSIEAKVRQQQKLFKKR